MEKLNQLLKSTPLQGEMFCKIDKLMVQLLLYIINLVNY